MPESCCQDSLSVSDERFLRPICSDIANGFGVGRFLMLHKKTRDTVVVGTLILS